MSVAILAQACALRRRVVVVCAMADNPRQSGDGEPDAKKARLDEASGGNVDGAAGVDVDGGDGPLDDDEVVEQGGRKRVKRKLVLVLGYLGFRYRGLMINYEIEEAAQVKSVEYYLRQGLVRAGMVSALNAERLEQKIGWTRSSRTDAGVSAVRLIISGRFLVHEDEFDTEDHNPGAVADLNRELPEDIRCFSAVRVPRSFDAKRSCSWREYEYLLPVAMCVPRGPAREGAEDAALAAVQRVMSRFEGCHSFHNFSRLKASDLAWRGAAEPGDEGGGDAEDAGAGQGRGKGGKGKSKGKGKAKGGKGGKGKGKAGRASRAPAETDGADGARAEAPAAVEDPVVALEETKLQSPPTSAADAMGAADAPSGADRKPLPEPPWLDICARDAASGAWRERPPEVLKHTQTTMWMCVVEKTLNSGFLRVRLRGQFFLYNQIRLMVGTAAAIARGTLPEELLELALQLPVEMHMPLAPPTGLFQRTSGFSMLDPRAGFAAMDAEQATLCMLPASGFVLCDAPGTEAAEAFVLRVEAEIARLWREGGEAEAWSQKLDAVRVPQPAVLAELRALAGQAAEREEGFKQQQAEGDERRRRSSLEDGVSFAGVMPRRFATALMVRFRLIPSWRVSHVQHALAQRLRRWSKQPDERPAGISSPPEIAELLEYVESVGLQALAEEGASDT